MDGLRGKFVVLDGPDGAGKSTVGRLLVQRLTEVGVPVVQCKDPGGTRIGDRIRSILLDFDLATMDHRCETLLFMASRSQLVAEIVRPALAAGNLVLCDRFISATCAYQVAAGDDLDAILELGRLAVGDTWPAMTFVLDVPPEIGFERLHRRQDTSRTASSRGEVAAALTGRLDAMERRPRSFHDQVRANFLALPGRYPAPVEIVDASASLEQVVETLWKRLERLGEQ